MKDTDPRRHLILGVSFVTVAIAGACAGFLGIAHADPTPTASYSVVHGTNQNVLPLTWLSAPAEPSHA